MTFVYWARGIVVLLLVPAAWITVLRDAALVRVYNIMLNPGINLGIRMVTKKTPNELIHLDIFYQKITLYMATMSF